MPIAEPVPAIQNPKSIDVGLTFSVGLPSPMTHTRATRLAAFKAVLASLLLAVGSLSAHASLVTRSFDACAMTCCVERGHCCCSPRHTNVKEVPRTGQTSVEKPSVSTRCPDGCAPSTPVNNLFARDARETGRQSVPSVGSALPGRQQAALSISAVFEEDSSPRGPPTVSVKL